MILLHTEREEEEIKYSSMLVLIYLITINPQLRLITASVNETILKHVSASGVKGA